MKEIVSQKVQCCVTLLTLARRSGAEESQDEFNARGVLVLSGRRSGDGFVTMGRQVTGSNRPNC